MPAWTITTVKNSALLNTIVPITTNTAGNPPPWVPAAQMRLDLEAGDVVVFASAVETRTNAVYAINSAGLLRRTLNAQYINPADPKDAAGILARPMGWNIWATPHYRIDHKTAVWQADATGVHVIQHVIYGASSAFTGDPADRLDIMYADQQALILHPEPDDPRWAGLDTVAAAVAGLLDRVALLEADLPGCP